MKRRVHALKVHLDKESARISQHKRRIRRRRWKPPSPFYVNAQYKDFDRDRDKEICEVAGRKHSDGSGYAFLTEMRDLSFGFDRRSSAIACAKRVSKLRGVKATVEGRVWP